MSSSINIEKIVYDPSEVHMGTLGINYLQSFLDSGILSKTVLVLTDKRLYQKGKSYEKNNKNGYNKINTQKVVDLKDITGTSFFEFDPFIIKISAIILIILGVIFFFLGESEGAFFMIAGSIFSFILYKISLKRFFVVEYAGGAIYTDSSLYDEAEINEFQKAISNLKDSHFKNVSKSNNQNEKDLNNVSGINVKSKEDRLIELNALYEKQLLSTDEYNEMKKNIILDY
jgi:hypothetical protein